MLFSGILLSFSLFLALGYLSAPFVLWALAVVAAAWAWGASTVFLLVLSVLFIVMSIKTFRQQLFSSSVMAILKKLKLMPKISETEKTALEAGTTWLDGELFSGSPDFSKILKESYPELTAEEKAFLDGPCEKLCDIMDDEQAYIDGDLSVEVWDFLKKEKFLGLIIPKEFGGLGFSALAHSAVVSKVSSHSIPLAISIMVPNSLGPAELLIHYGTKEQKDKYLPKLANGEEIPCFGLTEPTAGSDAGSIKSSAVVFKGDDGQLYLRMNWDKRWITLGAASTLLGLAVKLYDPENLLGKGKDLGITCVLVPSETKGVSLGRRHDPLGVPFINSPIRGIDVIVSVDQIIGGLDGAGRGWRMLMECLAAGRSISLPSQASGSTKFVSRVASSYCKVRHQFGMPIGKFEGVDEALARIGAFTYLLDAARVFTAGAVDAGVKPSVISAIVKYHSTEFGRKIINDAMDVFGGSAITQGPKNFLAKKFIASPIAITVEGANILTRTMIIFGQGAIRCHPYAYKEVIALENNDSESFDRAFCGHISHVVKNACRSLVFTLTRGAFISVPSGKTSKHLKKLTWTSASFAFLADVAMGTLGGNLKFREKVTGRFADILSWMYLITATIRRYHAEGEKEEHLTFVNYIASYGFHQIQEAFDGIYQNLDFPVVGQFFKYIVGPWSRFNQLSSPPSDALGSKLSHLYLKPGSMRDDLTDSIYVSKDAESHYNTLEEAFSLASSASKVQRKIIAAMKDGLIEKGKPMSKLEEALKNKIITPKDADVLSKAKQAVDTAIQVDSYLVEDYKSGQLNTSTTPLH